MKNVKKLSEKKLHFDTLPRRCRDLFLQRCSTFPTTFFLGVQVIFRVALFYSALQLFLKQKKLHHSANFYKSIYATTKKRKNSIYGVATFSVLEIVARKVITAQIYLK